MNDRLVYAYTDNPDTPRYMILRVGAITNQYLHETGETKRYWELAREFNWYNKSVVYPRAIFGSFPWSSTPEGPKYWEKHDDCIAELFNKGIKHER